MDNEGCTPLFIGIKGGYGSYTIHTPFYLNPLAPHRLTIIRASFCTQKMVPFAAVEAPRIHARVCATSEPNGSYTSPQWVYMYDVYIQHLPLTHEGIVKKLIFF
jgi:hypothetical protein